MLVDWGILMKKICVSVESIASSLFLLGYDSIDPWLFQTIVNDISVSSSDRLYKDVAVDGSLYSCVIEFSDEKFSEAFSNCVDTSFGIRIKDGISMNTDVSTFLERKKYFCSFGRYLKRINNLLLSSYIDTYIDLERITFDKVDFYGEENISLYPILLCDKERGILDANANILKKRGKK